LPHPEPGDLRAHLDDVAGQFVAEDRRRNDHARMITPPEYFHVGAARQRRLDADQNISLANPRNGHRLNL
jgi:hypothetical protein